MSFSIITSFSTENSTAKECLDNFTNRYIAVAALQELSSRISTYGLKLDRFGFIDLDSLPVATAEKPLDDCYDVLLGFDDGNTVLLLDDRYAIPDIEYEYENDYWIGLHDHMVANGYHPYGEMIATAEWLTDDQKNALGLVYSDNWYGLVDPDYA